MKKWNEQYAVDELIVFENEDFIVANKPPGVKSQDDPTEGISITSWLEEELNMKLHISNRLDRPVSGAIVFSKSKKGNLRLTKQKEPLKEYIAVVHKWENPEHELVHFIMRDGKSKKAIISNHPTHGFKKCQLTCKLLHQLDHYTLLLVTPSTGRFHQIRVQLGSAGFPIKGDVKYGARRSNKDRSIDLHACSILLPGSSDKIIVHPLRKDGLWKAISALNIYQGI